MTTISAVTWNRLSCCEGGANIGASMLWLLRLALLAGASLWGTITVVARRINR